MNKYKIIYYNHILQKSKNLKINNILTTSSFVFTWTWALNDGKRTEYFKHQNKKLSYLLFIILWIYYYYVNTLFSYFVFASINACGTETRYAKAHSATMLYCFLDRSFSLFSQNQKSGVGGFY